MYNMKLQQYQSNIKVGIHPIGKHERFTMAEPFRYYCDLSNVDFYEFLSHQYIRSRRPDHVPPIKTCHFRSYMQFYYSHQIDSDSKYSYVLSHRIPVIIPFACHCTSGSCCPIDDECGDWENVRVIQIGIDMRRQLYDFVIVCILYDHHDTTEYKFNNKIFHSARLNGMTQKRSTVSHESKKS